MEVNVWVYIFNQTNHENIGTRIRAALSCLNKKRLGPQDFGRESLWNAWCFPPYPPRICSENSTRPLFSHMAEQAFLKFLQKQFLYKSGGKFSSWYLNTVCFKGFKWMEMVISNNFNFPFPK